VWWITCRSTIDFQPQWEALKFVSFRLCSNDVDIPVGGIISTGMHNENGGYENDCMLVRKHSDAYFMISPTQQQTRIKEWMLHHLPSDGSVDVLDVTR